MRRLIFALDYSRKSCLGSHMDTTPLFPVQVGDRIIPCETLEDYQLILEAAIVCQSLDEARSFTRDQLKRMSEACGRYDLGTMARITKDLAAESNS